MMLFLFLFLIMMLAIHCFGLALRAIASAAAGHHLVFVFLFIFIFFFFSRAGLPGMFVFVLHYRPRGLLGFYFVGIARMADGHCPAHLVSALLHDMGKFMS